MPVVTALLIVKLSPVRFKLVMPVALRFNGPAKEVSPDPVVWVIEAALMPLTASEAVKLAELAIVIAPTAVVFPTAPVKVTFPVPAVKLSGSVPSMLELNVIFLLVPLELNALVPVKVTALANEISPLAVVMAAPVETVPAPSWEKDPPMLNAALGSVN